jgi:hypothetical protein
MLKEEKVNRLKVIFMDTDDILHKLDELESNVGLQNILPFYDEIMDMTLAGMSIKAEDLDNYYKLYSKTFSYANIKMSEAFRNVMINPKSIIEDLYKFTPWHSRLWFRIKRLFKV